MRLKITTLYSTFLWLLAATTAIAWAGGCKEDSLRPTTRPVLKANQQFAPILPYVLQPGDVVEVKFYYQATLDQSVTVRPDGKISLPLVDDIQAAGRTLPQLDADLTNLYLQKIRDPELTVILTQATGQRIYVGGEVNAPGTFVLSGSVSAIQAIMQAGGQRKTGHMESVVLLRNQGKPQPEFMVLNLRNDIIGTAALSEDIALRAGDVVFVPKTKIAEADDFVEQYIDKLIPVFRSVGLQYQWTDVK